MRHTSSTSDSSVPHPSSEEDAYDGVVDGLLCALEVRAVVDRHAVHLALLAILKQLRIALYDPQNPKNTRVTMKGAKRYINRILSLPEALRLFQAIGYVFDEGSRSFRLSRMRDPVEAVQTVERLRRVKKTVQKWLAADALRAAPSMEELLGRGDENGYAWEIAGLSKEALENDTINRICGCLYGNALGDAVGLSTEFLTKEDVLEYYGDAPVPFPGFFPTNHNIRWDMGDWTDDTDQLVLILDTILENGRPDRHIFARKLLYWGDNGFPELGDTAGSGLGSTTNKVLNHPWMLEDPHRAAKEVWEEMGRNAAPNGAVMRTSILGCFEYHDLEKVIANTIEIAKVSHFDSRCVSSCVAITTAIALILQRGAAAVASEDATAAVLEEALANAAKHLDEVWKEEFAAHIPRDESKRSLEALKLDEHKKIGYTLKCLGAGVWGLLNSSRSFAQAMQLICREAGDTDTNGAVFGAMLGVKVGYGALPRAWLAALPHKRWLDHRVVRLLHHMRLVDEGGALVARDASPLPAATTTSMSSDEEYARALHEELNGTPHPRHHHAVEEEEEEEELVVAGVR